MPVTVTQSPTTPNAAYTRLVYVASGSVTTSEPQYQYVMDVYQSGSSELINRITQVPNPAGVAVFDPSPILQGQLQMDNNWKTLGATGPTSSVQTFDIRFGEQYGTSDSSSVTVYTGSTSNYLEVFPGIVNENNGVSYNFNTSSFTEPLNNPYLTNAPYAFNNPLEEFPATGYHGLMNSEDYFTATTFGDTFLDPATINVQVLNFVNGQSVGSGVTAITIPLTPPSGSFNTIGLGPKNLAEYSPAFSASLAAGNVNFIYTSNDFGGISYYINDKWDGVPVTDPTISSLRTYIQHPQ